MPSNSADTAEDRETPGAEETRNDAKPRARGDAGVPGRDADEASAEEAQPHQEELDPETRARRDAALRHVRKLGDPVLRAAALPVDRFDGALKAEIERMGILMRDALGIGLAANQVGVLHRVFVYRVDPEEPVTAVVNPVIEQASDELEVAEEGCLSLPGVHVEVERPANVRLRGQDADGRELLVEASGLEARVIQHEIDHLDGILILDRISREARKEAMRAMREAAEGHPERASGEHPERTPESAASAPATVGSASG
jgi:peptide deformylase